jgi:hypothetical protein
MAYYAGMYVIYEQNPVPLQANTQGQPPVQNPPQHQPQYQQAAATQAPQPAAQQWGQAQTGYNADPSYQPQTGQQPYQPSWNTQQGVAYNPYQQPVPQQPAPTQFNQAPQFENTPSFPGYPQYQTTPQSQLQQQSGNLYKPLTYPSGKKSKSCKKYYEQKACGHDTLAKYEHCYGGHPNTPTDNENCSRQNQGFFSGFTTKTVRAGNEYCNDHCRAATTGWRCCTCNFIWVTGKVNSNGQLVHQATGGHQHAFCGNCSVDFQANLVQNVGGSTPGTVNNWNLTANALSMSLI